MSKLKQTPVVSPVADAPGSPGVGEPGASATGAPALDTTTVRRWKRYPEYRPSGTDWLPQVPRHWEQQRADARLVRVFSSVDPKVLNAETVFHYSIPAIEETGDGIFQAAEEIDSNKLLLSGGELLVSKLNPRKSRVLIALAHDVPTVCSSEFVALKPRGCHPEFARYLYGSEWVRQTLDANVDSVTRSHQRANPSVITKLWVAWPPLVEQRAIAAFLDRETARIDALIGHKERLIALLEEKRQAVISHAVTRGLDPSAPLKDSGIPWLGPVPEHWHVRRTKFVARLESGHTPSRQHPEYWENCTIPWITLADVWQLRDGWQEYISGTEEKVSELGIANSAARLLPTGTVIVSRTASVGFSGIMASPMATSQDYVNWVCGPTMRPEYLLYVFRSMQEEFRRLVMGSTHKTIYMPDVNGFQTPVPPIDEQERIVAHIRKANARTRALLDRIRDGIARLQEYRTALISAAVTGQIDVRGEVELSSEEDPT
jgi:type I restriction enzyme S subunit